MKLINISKVLLLSGILVFGGCKLKDPTENVQIKIDTEKLLPVNFSLQFVDQATGSAIVDKEVKIEISGSGASKIYEISGTKTFKVANGMINLSILKEAIPSETNPLNFTVTASAEGYLASTSTLIYTDAESKSFDIPMVSLNNLPESITKTSVKVDNTVDGLTNELTITFTDIHGTEKLVLYIICALIIILGVYPKPLLHLTEASVQHLLEQVNQKLTVK